MGIARLLHVLGAVVWVGGMFSPTWHCGRLRRRCWSRCSDCLCGRRRFDASSSGCGCACSDCWSGLWMILLTGRFHAVSPHVHLMPWSGWS